MPAVTGHHLGVRIREGFWPTASYRHFNTTPHRSTAPSPFSFRCSLDIPIFRWFGFGASMGRDFANVITYPAYLRWALIRKQVMARQGMLRRDSGVTGFRSEGRRRGDGHNFIVSQRGHLLLWHIPISIFWKPRWLNKEMLHKVYFTLDSWESERGVWNTSVFHWVPPIPLALRQSETGEVIFYLLAIAAVRRSDMKPRSWSGLTSHIPSEVCAGSVVSTVSSSQASLPLYKVPDPREWRSPPPR